jgi:hypothetical protein
MDQSKHKWAVGEVDSRYPDPETPERKCLYALLHVWERLESFAGETKQQPDRDEVLDAFVKLVRGETIADPDLVEAKRAWAPAGQFVEVGASARVRTDYEDGPDGWRLNGRTGRIVGLRRGSVVLEFDKPLEGAPDGFRGTVKDVEVDITALVGSQ